MKYTDNEFKILEFALQRLSFALTVDKELSNRSSITIDNVTSLYLKIKRENKTQSPFEDLKKGIKIVWDQAHKK